MKPFSPEIPNRRKHQRAFFVTWFPDVITAFSMYRFSRERPKIVLQVVIIRLPLGSRDPGDSVIIMGSSPRLLLFGRDSKNNIQIYILYFGSQFLYSKFTTLSSFNSNISSRRRSGIFLSHSTFSPLLQFSTFFHIVRKICIWNLCAISK